MRVTSLVPPILIALAACDQGAKPIAAERSAPRSDASMRSVHADARTVDAALLELHAVDARYIELPENNGDEQNCIKFVAGTAREQALLCDEIDEDYWRVTRQWVRVVRAGKRVRVLDIPTKIEGFDTGVKMLELRLRISSDGMSAMTVDGVPKPDGGQGSVQPGPVDACDRAPNRYDLEAGQGLGVTPYGVVRRRLCDVRGTYQWIGDRFVRVQ